MHVLGIDAGGTKTVCLLANDAGEVLAEGRGGGANLQSAGELEVEKVLHHVMEAALARYAAGPDASPDIRPASICLGIAGVDRPADADAVRGIMRRIGFKTETLVVNDALVALVAGAGDAPAVVVVAGTGSIAYGRNALGQAARSGGWGYLLGDEGGGFWIGRSALAAVVRQFDGRGPATLLTAMILDHMRLGSPTELIYEIYYRGLQRHAISGLAALVQRATDAGDAVAAQILKRAGRELAAAAASVITRLGMRGETFPTVLAGGIFHGVPWLKGDVEAQVSEVAPRSVIRLLDVEPAVGAVRLAIAAAKGTLQIPSYIEAG
jgi:N-acetylglucosamine kinase-like BadF-type ATPase